MKNESGVTMIMVSRPLLQCFEGDIAITLHTLLYYAENIEDTSLKESEILKEDICIDTGIPQLRIIKALNYLETAGIITWNDSEDTFSILYTIDYDILEPMIESKLYE